MSSSEEKKLVLVPKVVPMMSKITEDKLTGPNYSDWSKTTRLYLRSIRMAVILIRTLLLMIRKNDGWRMMPVSSYKSVIPLKVKYSPSLITASLLRR